MPTSIDLYINLETGSITTALPDGDVLVMTFTPSAQEMNTKFIEQLIGMKAAASGLNGYAKIVIPIA